MQGMHGPEVTCWTSYMGQRYMACVADIVARLQGKFLVLGGLKAMNGQLEFFSADDGEVMNAAEHFMCTNIEWDPTGRYVATSVTSIHQMENGFNIWLFNGTLLYRCACQGRPLCLHPCQTLLPCCDAGLGRPLCF